MSRGLYRRMKRSTASWSPTRDATSRRAWMVVASWVRAAPTASCCSAIWRSSAAAAAAPDTKRASRSRNWAMWVAAASKSSAARARRRPSTASVRPTVAVMWVSVLLTRDWATSSWRTLRDTRSDRDAVEAMLVARAWASTLRLRRGCGGVREGEKVRGKMPAAAVRARKKKSVRIEKQTRARTRQPPWGEGGHVTHVPTRPCLHNHPRPGLRGSATHVGAGKGVGARPMPCTPARPTPDPGAPQPGRGRAARPRGLPPRPAPPPPPEVDQHGVERPLGGVAAPRKWLPEKSILRTPAPLSHLAGPLRQAGQVSLEARARGEQGLELALHALFRARHIHQRPAHFRQAGQLVGRAKLQGGGRVGRGVGHGVVGVQKTHKNKIKQIDLKILGTRFAFVFTRLSLSALSLTRRRRWPWPARPPRWASRTR